MADLSFLSDTDESAVEELISQAQDLSVLEQISAINCSSFTDSVLPSDLETRFRKLKSFPLTKNKKPINSSSVDPKTPINHTGKESKDKSLSGSPSETDSAIFSPSKQNPDGKMTPEPKFEPGHASSPDFSTEKSTFTPSKKNPNSNSSNSLTSSPSPPKKNGCFWCSPKKGSNRKCRNENSVMENSLDWGKDEGFLSDLSIFSTKEQQKILKKAMKEEQKVCKEAEKIVKWAKQASARMSFFSVIADEVSDEEIAK